MPTLTMPTANAQLSQNLSHFCLVQLSDLHLTGEIGVDDSYRRFLDILTHIVAYQPNALLLTGDLVNDGNTAGYDWLFGQLDGVGIPYFAMAGNHDVTAEHGSHLPFAERTFSPIAKDKRLLDNFCCTLNDWQLIGINSAIAGRIDGRLSDDTLAWLDNALCQNAQNLPVILALHHHPVAVGSQWIDEHRLKNGDDLLEILNKYDCVKLVLHGHIHQVFEQNNQHYRILSVPAVSKTQFLPKADEFALDDQPSGFRLMDLTKTGGFLSKVIRIGAENTKIA